MVKRTPTLIKERERLAWEMRLQFYTESRIGKELGISQPAVSKILKRLNQRDASELAASVIEIQKLQLQQLAHIADESFQAWANSIQPRPDVQGVLRRGDGDPRYLVICMRALADIRKITGADAPRELTIRDTRKM